MLGSYELLIIPSLLSIFFGKFSSDLLKVSIRLAADGPLTLPSLFDYPMNLLTTVHFFSFSLFVSNTSSVMRRIDFVKSLYQFAEAMERKGYSVTVHLPNHSSGGRSLS